MEHCLLAVCRVAAPEVGGLAYQTLPVALTVHKVGNTVLAVLAVLVEECHQNLQAKYREGVQVDRNREASKPDPGMLAVRSRHSQC